MAAVSTKGLSCWLTKGDAVPVALVPTAITKAAPAVVTVASTTGILLGDVVDVGTVGFNELDQKLFVVGTITSTTFELIGSDTVASVGNLVADPDLKVYKAAEQVKLCLATVVPAVTQGSTISTGTFCVPTASIAAEATDAGTITLTGYIENPIDDGYDELNKAVEDATERILQILLPQGVGYIVVPITLSSMGWDLPLQGAIGFTAGGSMGAKPAHRY